MPDRLARLRRYVTAKPLMMTVVPWHLALLATAYWTNTVLAALILAAFDIIFMALTIGFYRFAEEIRQQQNPRKPRRLPRIRSLGS